MRSRLVKKFYCDHCKKSGCRRDIIEAHERACTANPNRFCRCCNMAANKQPSLRELLTAIARDIDKHGDGDGNDPWIELTELRRVTKNCPACILSAIRLSPQPPCAMFTFADEIKTWLDEYGTKREMY